MEVDVMEHVLEKYGIDYKDGIVNRGNLGRLKKCMEKARQGGKLTLVFIGGSTFVVADALRCEF